MSQPLNRLTNLGSKLRCIANGDEEVNGNRSRLNGAVRELPEKKFRAFRQIDMATTFTARLAPSEKPKRGPRQKKLASNVEVNVFILFDDENATLPASVQRRSGRIGLTSIRLSDLHKLDGSKSVQSIELAESLSRPDYVQGGPASAAPKRDTLNVEYRNDKGDVTKSYPATGKGAIIGIVDVGGIDFAHEDFIDPTTGKSRILAIWDQGGDTFQSPKLPVNDSIVGKSRASYGSEIKHDDIDFALTNASRAKLTPYDLAPQSQMEIGSHATHVTSIAAGNSGVCPKADIACVMVSLPASDLRRRRSFYDTRCVMDAISYLFDLGRRYGKPVSINISLGTNGGAHDGTELPSRWINTALFNPGRSICVAAGNSGQERALFKGDLGFWSGRIHTSGRIPAEGLRHDIEWVVTGDGVADLSENEVEIWYGCSDTFGVELCTPDGKWIGPVNPRTRIENVMLKSGTFVSIYNEMSDPKNGDNKISIFLSPKLKGEIIGVQAGTWKIRLTGYAIRDGRFHAWIERDDPRQLGAGTWSLPSYFADGSYVDNSTVSSLACGPRVIGVANMDDANERMNASSSQGPTRDGRSKPEIAAPGTNIVAAKGFDPDEHWIRMTGTSMASPYVAGVAGLMLSIDRHLTAAQIAGIIQRTSRPMPGIGYGWDNSAGYGRINPQYCLDQVVMKTKKVKDLTARMKRDRNL